jgi:hypothetical protein
MPDTKRLLNTLRRAADLFQQTPGRRGRFIHLKDCTEVVVAGDMHGNVDNLRRLLLVAELDQAPARHLVLQELIHGPYRYALGGDRSHQMLDLLAALKCQFPHQVHMLLGNHELAQWTDEFLLKGDDDLLRLFDQGVHDSYAPRGDEVLAAYDELFARLPIALRTDNDIYLCHSLPAGKRLGRFDPARLVREDLPASEYAPGSSIHALLWGRDTSEENVQAFLKLVSASLLISGHVPCDEGFATPNSRQLILDSQGTPGCYCRFPTDRTLNLTDLVTGVAQL